jgi:hypothetical protein
VGTFNGKQTFSKMVTISSGAIVHGFIDGSDATTGYVGEYIESITLQASEVSLPSTNVFYNVASITLTAGDWDIFGNCMVGDVSTIETANKAAISVYSANTLTDHVSGYNELWGAPATGAYNMPHAFAPRRVSITGSTVYYLKALSQRATGACYGWGYIAARRIR